MTPDLLIPAQAILVGASPDRTEAPAIAGLDAGRLVTAWTDEVASADGSGYAVQAQINELTRTLTSDGAGDTLTGDALRDTLLGNGGGDLLKGLGAKDTLDGGTGDNVVIQE